MKFHFNEKKAAQAASMLIKKSGGEMNYTALVKLLYLIDRECLIRHGYTLTGDDPVSMPAGPALTTMVDLLSQQKQKFPDQKWHEYIPRPKPLVYTVKVKLDPGDDELSAAAVRIIEEVYEEHKSKGLDELLDFVHDLPEFEDPGKSSKPIRFEKILESEGFSSKEIEAIAEGATSSFPILAMDC